MTGPPNLEAHADAPGELAAHWLRDERRVLLLGQSGLGKTTLAARLASILADQGRLVSCIGADPGSPAFGPPGAVGLAHWKQGAWATQKLVALCTLDAARFRLPLLSAVADLARPASGETLLVDTPGMVRGVAGAELLDALVRAAAIDLILVLGRPGQPLPLHQELSALAVQLVSIQASNQARGPSQQRRARERTRQWDRYLSDSVDRRVTLSHVHLLGTPPRKAAEAWQGKQLAFLAPGREPVMGEVVRADGETLGVRLPAGLEPTPNLLVRDACRGADGLLRTSRPFAAELAHYLPPPDVLPDALATPPTGVRPVVQVGTATAALVNGVFGDPLLHLRLRHQRRSLLLDLGEGTRLPARIAHQVTDIFVSHAHADHISGFLWLLRSRIGEQGVCRLFGPPGLARQLQGFLTAILWDRIGDRGPRFEVAEVHGDRLCRYHLQAGRGEPTPLAEVPLPDAVLLREAGFRVRFAPLDHGTPVLAFAYEPSLQIKVRTEQLAELGLAPGPWLTGLKQHILKGDYDAELRLPDGRRRTVAALAAELTAVSPGDSLVYATDFSDTPRNRERLIGLAAGAHTLFCESSFLEADRAQAMRTGHLTTRGCGEIARAAGVRHLIPFHFSRRYEDAPWHVYEEIAAVCPQTVVPKQPSRGERSG